MPAPISAARSAPVDALYWYGGRRLTSCLVLCGCNGRASLAMHLSPFLKELQFRIATVYRTRCSLTSCGVRFIFARAARAGASPAPTLLRSGLPIPYRVGAGLAPALASV